MKNIKKKLISLLSAACLTAGAFGIAACKKDNNQDPPPAATLQSTYLSYVQNVGQDALNYEDWLVNIKKDIVPNISSKSILNAEILNSRLVLKYKDGTEQTVGTVTGNFEIKVIGTNVTVNAPSASATKSAVSAAAGDTELKDEYDKYVGVVGENALVYDSWLDLITNDFVLKTNNLKTIRSAEINSKAQFIITYQDNAKTTVGFVTGNLSVNVNGTTQNIEVPVFTVTAVDQNQNPVKDVWVKLYSYNTNTYTSSTLVTTKTNAEGKAYFAYKPQDNVNYRAGLADVTDTVPAGYQLNLGTENDMAITSVSFDAEKNATMTFKYAPDAFVSAQKKDINYKRAYNASSGKPQETKRPTEAELQANRYAYFLFSPYTAASGSNDAKAVAAATGKYKISISASAGAKVVMYHYKGNYNYLPCDAETGIPNVIEHATGNAPQNAADASVYTGTNYIELNLYSDIVRGENIFGVVADKNCTVTINVERTDDSTEPPVAETVEVKVTGNPQKCPEQSGILTEVATDGSAKIVLGNDGYYHVGDKNGPILYATLGRALRRVSDVAIKDMPDQKLEGHSEPLGERVFLLTAEYDENGFATLIKDFNNVIKTYGALCNSDGVYAVNEDLYDFLHLYGHNCFGVIDLEDKSLAWLLPCQYYA